MNHESQQSHAQSSEAVVPNQPDVEPGQSSRSALLRKPDHAIASGLIQRRARDANGVAEGADEAVASASSSSGSPLPDTLMQKFEGSLGADLSGVRVHTGESSATANDAVGAKAYTMGQDIHFGAGQYDPSSPSGEHLLAHEVAHTVQQAGGAQRMQFKLEVSTPGDHLEREADRAADAMVSGQSAVIGSAPPAVAREAKEPGAKSPAVKGEDMEITFGSTAGPKMALGPFQLTPKLAGKIVLHPADHGKPAAGGEGEKKEAGEHAEGHPVEVKGAIDKNSAKVAAEKKFGPKTWGIQPKLVGEAELDKEGKPKLKLGVTLEHEGIKFTDATIGPLTAEGTAVKWEKGAAEPTIAAISLKFAISAKSSTPYLGYTVMPTLEAEAEIEPNWEKIGEWIAKRMASAIASGAAGAAGAIAAPMIMAAGMLFAWAKAGHEFDETHRKIESLRASCQLAAYEAISGKHAKVMVFDKDVNADSTAMANSIRAAVCTELKIPEGALPAVAKADASIPNFIYLKAWAKAWPGLKAQLLELYKDTTFTSKKFERQWLDAFDKGET